MVTQRHVAQIGAPGQRRLGQRLALGDDALGEVVGNAVAVHGDEADLPLVVRIADRFQHARLRDVEASLLGEIEAHEIAVLRRAFVALGDRPGAQLLAVDGLDAAAAVAVRAEDADQAPLLARQPLDREGFEAIADAGIVDLADARQHAVADADARLDVDLRPARLARRDQNFGALALFLPHGRLGDEVAVVVAPRHLQHRDGRQPALLAQALAIARQRAFLGHAGEQAVELDALRAAHAEGARDLALADLGRRRLDELDDLVAARQPVTLGWAASLVALRFAWHVSVPGGGSWSA